MEETAFKEEQPLSQVWWILFIILGTAGLMWYGFVQQIIWGQPFGTNPGPDWLIWLLWLLIGLGLPGVWLITKLVVEVKNDHILIRYFPFVTRRIPFTDIRHFQARTYSPLKEYGGWGIRGWGNKIAYNVSGNQGVELTLNNEQKIMIGSQRASELALALESKIKQ